MSKTPKFQPLGSRVQFERIPHPTPKPGEIITPRPPSQRCRILAVGPKCEHVRPGMLVLIPLNSGMIVQGVEGRVGRESEVLCILEGAID